MARRGYHSGLPVTRPGTSSQPGIVKHPRCPECLRNWRRSARQAIGRERSPHAHARSRRASRVAAVTAWASLGNLHESLFCVPRGGFATTRKIASAAFGLGFRVGKNPRKQRGFEVSREVLFRGGELDVAPAGFRPEGGATSIEGDRGTGPATSFGRRGIR